MFSKIVNLFRWRHVVPESEEVEYPSAKMVQMTPDTLDRLLGLMRDQRLNDMTINEALEDIFSKL